MDSHDLSPFGSDLKAYMLEATGTWYVRHEFSDCRRDTVCIWYNDKRSYKGMEQKLKSDMIQSGGTYK